VHRTPRGRRPRQNNECGSLQRGARVKQGAAPPPGENWHRYDCLIRYLHITAIQIDKKKEGLLF
jgi:hypothetical protein